MQGIRERKFRDSRSIANTKICFEVRATALRPRLHIEGFLLCPNRTSHTGNLHRGICNYKVRSTQLSLQDNHLFKRGNAQSQNNNHLYTRGIKAQSQTITSITYTQRGITTNPKQNHLYTRHKAKSNERLQLCDHNRPQTTLVDLNRPQTIFLIKTRSYRYDRDDSSSVRKTRCLENKSQRKILGKTTRIR